MRKTTVTFVALLVASMFLIQVTANDYNPWLDTNDNGKIDIFDVVDVASRYGTTGTPINITDLLLELQDKIALLNASLSELQTHVGILNATKLERLTTTQDGLISIFHPMQS